MNESSKYWAFISYSHDDSEWAEWLHRRLEQYRIPPRLRVEPLNAHAAPDRLYPVFRDRDELPSSAELGGVIQQALQQSRYLIVICSPQAAASRWVNEEVRSFKALGRAHRILCLIVDGEPGDAARECFAPALRRDVDAEGELAMRVAEPIAADARPGRDSRDVAFLRLAAGVLGVSYDDLRQREKRRQRWQRLQWVAAAALMLLVAGLGWQQAQRQKANALDAQARSLQVAQSLESGMRELREGHAARAAVFLQAALAQGLDTPALRYLLARAMQPVDALVREFEPVGQNLYTPFFSPDGRRYAANLADNREVAVWDTDSGRLALRATVSDQLGIYVFTPMLSRDGRRLFLPVDLPEPALPRNQLWDVDSGRKLRDEPGSASRAAPSYPYSADGRELLMADDSARVRILDAQDGATLREVQLPEPPTLVMFAPRDDGLISGDEHGAVTLWSVPDARALRRFRGLDQAVSNVVVSNDGRWLAAGTRDGAVRIWDYRTAELKATTGHLAELIDLSFSADGERLLTVAEDGYRVIATATGALVMVSPDRGTQSRVAALSPDGRQLLSTRESLATVYDLSSAEPLFAIEGQSGAVYSAGYSPDGRYIATGSTDGRVLLWDARIAPRADLQHARVSGGITQSRVFDAQYDDAQARILSIGRDGLRSWDRHTFALQRHLAPLSGATAGGVVSEDRRYWALAEVDGRLRLFDAASARELRRWSGAAGDRVVLQIAADSQRLLSAVAGFETQATLWSRDADAPLARLPVDASAALRFAARGRDLFIGHHGQVQRWREAQAPAWTSAVLSAYGDTPPKVRSLRLSADGQQVLAASAGGEVQLLDADSGRLLRRSQAPALGGDVVSAAMSPDGHRIVVGTRAGKPALWDVAHDRWQVLAGLSGRIESLEFSPDGTRFIAAAGDGLVGAWDAQDGRYLGAVGAHRVVAGSARFSADGSTVLSAGDDNRVRLWDAGLETRDAATLGRLLRCRVPWQLEGARLQPRAPDPAACR